MRRLIFRKPMNIEGTVFHDAILSTEQWGCLLTSDAGLEKAREDVRALAMNDPPKNMQDPTLAKYEIKPGETEEILDPHY